MARSRRRVTAFTITTSECLHSMCRTSRCPPIVRPRTFSRRRRRTLWQKAIWSGCSRADRPAGVAADSSALVVSAKGEVKSLGARIDEFDLEGSVGDGPRLADQLIHARLAQGPGTLLIDVDPVGAARGRTVDA